MEVGSEAGPDGEADPEVAEESTPVILNNFPAVRDWGYVASPTE